MWFNLEAVELPDAPSFFQAFATEGLKARTQDFLFQDSLENKDSFFSVPRQPLDTWQQAYLKTGMDKALLREDIGDLELKNDLLFKARVQLPDNVVPGDYKVTVYQFASDRIASTSQQIMTVQRQGLNARLHGLSNNQAALYGLLCVLLAVAAGYGAAYMFRK